MKMKKGADDFAPEIVKYSGSREDAMKNGLIPVYKGAIPSLRVITNEIRVDL